jgi:hypothetical protein
VLVESFVYKKEKITHYKCVDACPKDYDEIFNRCYKRNKNGTEEFKLRDKFQEISQDMLATWPQIALVCFIAFVLAFSVLILFRIAIEYIIWIIYFSFIGVILTGACYLGFRAMKLKHGEKERTPLLVGAAVLAVIVVISLLLLCWFRRRIRLVAMLFKEAAKALIDVPSILFEPVLVRDLLNAITTYFHVS